MSEKISLDSSAMEDLIKKVPSGSIFVFPDGINILSKRIITF